MRERSKTHQSQLFLPRNLADTGLADTAHHLQLLCWYFFPLWQKNKGVLENKGREAFLPAEAWPPLSAQVSQRKTTTSATLGLDPQVGTGDSIMTCRETESGMQSDPWLSIQHLLCLHEGTCPTGASLVPNTCQEWPQQHQTLKI